MKPAPKTFHVKSFGCQMNVYDGDRMTELLEAEGLSAAADADSADLVVLNTCHIREKAAEKVYSDIGRIVKRSDGAPPMIAVAGCVAQAEGRRDSAPGAERRHRRRPAGLSQSARPGSRRGGGPQGARHRHAGLVKVRCAAGAAAAGAQRLPHRAGGLRQILHLLRRALYARRRDQPALRGDRRRGEGAGRRGREGDHPARPERQRLGRGRGKASTT